MKLAALAGALALMPACWPRAESPETRATIVRAPKANVMAAIRAAYERAGHTCEIDKEGDLVCDKANQDEATVAFVFLPTAPGGPTIDIVTALEWKDADPCTAIAPTLNEIHKADVIFRLVCTPTNLTFIGNIDLPERGLVDRDLVTYVDAFKGEVASTLHEGDLIKLLK